MPAPRAGVTPEGIQKVVQNRRARHDYFILESIEAGIELRGTEVKSIRAGKVNLGDAYAQVIGDEAWLLQMHVSPYEQGNRFNHDPLRKRKLLLHRRQILRLRQHTQEKGLTLIPLSLYFKGRHLKIELGLAKGKRYHDRREDVARRDAQREIDRAMRGDRER
ncbi:MAG: SsrA-binding protein SmpB [Candidatus Eisenbacteria bacterium]|nr:SsrA-binding protein SmpB [Candidatus Eisenbacteria bacterium]